jgi:2-oxoisovalerate dehydrogenase E1 component
LPRTRRPTFLHLKTTRVMGHAGTDFEIEWRSIEELVAVEATDPLLRSAAIALESGLYSKDALLNLYEPRASAVSRPPKMPIAPALTSLADVMKPLAPYTPAAVKAEATRADYADKRLAVFGGEAKLPENQPPRHLAIQINQALHDLLAKYPRRCCSARTWRRRAACIPSPRACTRRSRAAACSTRCSTKR